MAFPNIYGRKPSAVIRIEGNEFIRAFDSRRQAIFWRRNNTGIPSNYKIVPHGAQEPYYRFGKKEDENKPDKRKTGKQDDKRHSRKGSPDRTREGKKDGAKTPARNRPGNPQGAAGVPGSFAKGEGVVGSFV